jgi:lysylphosphatidylglycerol synthetase-like protein (DUF2156 family)
VYLGILVSGIVGIALLMISPGLEVALVVTYVMVVVEVVFVVVLLVEVEVVVVVVLDVIVVVVMTGAAGRTLSPISQRVRLTASAILLLPSAFMSLK